MSLLIWSLGLCRQVHGIELRYFLLPQTTSISFRYLAMVFSEAEPLAQYDTHGNVKVRTGHEVCREGFSQGPSRVSGGSRPQPVLSP